MSRRGSYFYSVGAAGAQWAQWAHRTSQITSEHLDRYQKILDDMREQGLVEFVDQEFEEISAMMGLARALTWSDPAAARDLSRQIGPRVGPLPRTARQLRARGRATGSQGRPRERADARGEAGENPAGVAGTPAKTIEDPAETAWHQALEQWTDLLARGLAHAELLALQEQLADDPPAAEQEPTGEDPENARRVAVSAVRDALEDAGFQVQSPRLIDGEVVVVGTRPSGASGTFNLALDGGLKYDFSGYRGSSCEADIDVVVPRLQEIYGIQLTDEVVVWRNPDDLDATARPQPSRTSSA